MHRPTRPQLVLPFVLSAAFVAAVPALAQDGGDAPAAGTARSGLSEAAGNFVHNVLIARPEQAQAAANVLLADDVDPSDLADAVDAGDLAKRMEDAFRRSRRMPEVSEAAAALETKLESGRQALARKIDRIEAAVKMLTGPMRGQMMARERLMAAGEYAVPALLRELVSGRDSAMEAAATRMLIDLRRQSALPLALALGSLDPAAQRKVCSVLGQLGYQVSVPALLDLAQSKGVTPDVSEAAMAAVRALGGTDGPAHAAYAQLSYSFLTGDVSLAAYPSEQTQNFWRWTEFGGLASDKVSTSVYYDVMAMFMARRALELDSSDDRALACFVAADLSREAAMGDGVMDPLFAGQGRSAQFYATVAGPKTMQDVIRIGIELSNTGLVRAGLAAMRETSGAAAMVGDGTTAVVAALDYPDRRVQFEAAFTLASVTPRAAFPGSEQVVPLLAQAVRGGSQTFVGIISPTDEDAQRVAGWARAMGFTPLTAARNSAEFNLIGARNAGCDLVVIAGNGAQVRREYEGVRALRMGEKVAAVLMAQPSDKPGLDELAGDSTMVLGADVSEDAFKAGVGDLMKSALGGGVGSADASNYVATAIDALTRIGLSRGGTYQIADAEAGLVDALRVQEGPVKAMVAEVLALVDSRRAQRAIIDAALAASGDEQAMLLGPVARSARRFGSQATAAQTDSIRDLVRTSSGSLADAAAAAYGALSLPSSEAVDLIIKARVPGTKSAAPADSGAAGDAGGEDMPVDPVEPAPVSEDAPPDTPSGNSDE